MKKSIKLSKSQWEEMGKKAGWVKSASYQLKSGQPRDNELSKKAEEVVLKSTPDRIENLRNIANFMIENCPREESKLMNTLWGYGQQLLIIAKELEHILELTEFRLVENPKGWD